MDPTFFSTESAFRRWLERNHEHAGELLVGFWKKAAGKPSLDWPQARDQALCFGWIDGIRRSRDAESYTIRFTPRRPRSEWSRVNLARYDALGKAGQMTEAGRRAFEAGRRSNYSYEKATAKLAEGELAIFRADPVAWANWQKLPPGYRRTVTHWVTSAKKPETRARRVATLRESLAAGRKMGVMETVKQ